jgi:hypothetical protein
MTQLAEHKIPESAINTIIPLTSEEEILDSQPDTGKSIFFFFIFII